MATYTAPGVFVEEVPAAAPIVGVGTSTPAFIGVWADGQAEPTPAGTVISITNITRFKKEFGDFTAPPEQGQPLNAGLNTLGHAVKGFFENGGTFCYVVRASNGSYQRLTLNDRTTSPGRPVIELQAREPGPLGIVAEVEDASYLTDVAIYDMLDEEEA